jgi:uncharacterized protein involved in cysteine biosynthesis
MTLLQRFLLGFGFVSSGLKLLRANKELRKWAVIPWLIDLILLGFGIARGGKYISRAVTDALELIMPPTNSLYSILYYPLAILFWVVFIGAMIYFLYIIAGFIASPFNSILADRTLAKLGAKKADELSIKRVGALAIRMFLISIGRGLILLLLGIFIFFLAFLPGLNFVVMFFAFLVICFDGADYSFEVLEFDLRQRFAFLRRYFVEFAGMACFIGLTLMVPGLILILMPAAVVGCASVIHRIRLRGEG